MLPNETQVFEDKRGAYTLSTDRFQLDIDYVLSFMKEKSYWGTDRTWDRLEKSIAGSIAFGIYHEGRQVGFARVITDCTEFAYLMDVFVDADHGGKGLGTWLAGTVLKHPDLDTVKYWRLGTLDAHKVYERAGWKMMEHPEWMMEMIKALPQATE